MSGLVLKLGPKERVLINGAVIENGDRRSKISILSKNANILRLRDAVAPEDANTPVKRACYLAQLLLTGEVDEELIVRRLKSEIIRLQDVFSRHAARDHLHQALEAIKKKDNYVCLKSLRQLLRHESVLLDG
jgi:flagellar protein FlbT